MTRQSTMILWFAILTALFFASCTTLRNIGKAGGGVCASEGTPAAPIEIILEEHHAGCVGPEGTSYYRLSVPFRADIYIEVTDHLGDAETFLFEEDATYSEWLSASQGNTMNVENYFVPSGTTLYFTVVDYKDEYSVGEQYTVYAYADYLLNSTGIFMNGEIYTLAQSIEPGELYTHTFSKAALEYFKITAKKSGTLIVKTGALPQEAELKWADADGQYSAVSIENDGDVWLMEISDISSGTVCFFYVVGALTVSGEEFTMSATYE